MMPWCPSYTLNSMSCEGQEMLGGGWLVDGGRGGGVDIRKWIEIGIWSDTGVI